MSSLGFYVVVGVAVFIRTLVSRLPANRSRGVDVGDMLLGAILGSTWLATGRNPFAAAGISGSHLNRNVVCASAAATLMLAGANGVVHKCILRRHGGWACRAGVNPGGAFAAVSMLPFRMALLAGLAYTSSGALLEELVFRWLLMGWIARMGGRPAGMAVQAVLFGVVHAAPMAACRAPIQVVLYAFAMPLACAVVFGWLTVASGGVACAWMVHWALNYIALVSALRSGRKEGPSAELRE
ncbi:MAG: CPBP family intramembrane glutamic endopeptidase [Bacillota bacterium]|jgi:membrane protease YdiL (CAAX protease family)